MQTRNLAFWPWLGTAAAAGLHWPVRFEKPLVEGVLLRRYQRFLADVRLNDGQEVVVHVPNSGRLTGVFHPGRRCWLLPTVSGKLRFRLEIVEVGSTLVGVNTLRAMRLAEEALTSNLLLLPGLNRPFSVRREVVPAPGSRLDLQLVDRRGVFWVEVKNITMVEGGEALFPDAVTARGAKHLRLLAELAAGGERTAVVYVVQRTDSLRVRAAAEVDPHYARAAWEAAQAGVVFAAVEVAASLEELRPARPLPVVLQPAG
ncbi:MAG: sugar fermentation stimulation protein [Thermoanaerobaculum sp.]|nr:MAG: sugar fermentation stimulation protein [Thermoanaerobaculum sp.]